MAKCAPGHKTGNKPWIVPVGGDSDLFVVRHGRDYLDSVGGVSRHPVRMTWADAEQTIATHNASTYSLTLTGAELVEILDLVAYRDLGVAGMLAAEAGIEDWVRP